MSVIKEKKFLNGQRNHLIIKTSRLQPRSTASLSLLCCESFVPLEGLVKCTLIPITDLKKKDFTIK